MSSREYHPHLADALNLLQATPADMFIHESVKDGDCGFDSVRQILLEADYATSNEFLRQTVAKAVLNPQDKFMNATIQNWLKIYQDAALTRDPQLLQDYSFMQFFADWHGPVRWTMEQRKELFRVMLNKNYYWADETALRTLENALHVHFIIVDAKTHRVMFTEHHNMESRYFALLWKRGQHFQPISVRGEFLFPIELLQRTDRDTPRSW